MKPTILYFTLIISSFTVFGQATEVSPFLLNLQRSGILPLSSRTSQQGHLTSEQTEIHQLDSLITYGLDESEGEWTIPLTRRIFEYNEDHHIISEELWSWDNNRREEYPVSKSEYSYNDDGSVSDIIYSKPAIEAGNWIPSQQESYYYKEDGTLKESLQKNYDITKGWMLVKKELYNYYNGHLGSVVKYVQGQQPEEMVAHSAYQYAYRGGYLEQVLAYKYIGKNSIPLMRQTYNYDYFNKLFMVREKYYDETSDSWIPSSVKGYSYDDDDDFVSYSIVTYDGGKVQDIDRSRYHFNKEVAGDQLIIPDLDPIELMAFHHMVTDKHVYKRDLGSKEEVKISVVKYFYSNLTVEGPTDPTNPKPVTGLSDSVDAIELFPNPASDYLHFNLPTNHKAFLRLLDNHGNQVLRQEIKKEQIDINHLIPGMYFYHVSCGSESIKGKLIKE
ncbi:T9SS type A sorting domain-containing protein [Fulvivirga sediminis]|uniref:T9SS type A sorting domain-containing protein n=1 Tax=Fulvivirga sediminis TaxID=2803949 RepID=A0A937FA92_9BACT|nr:T9SS type A sorting domain-containing protein [Fulvivirga sediminis]MBL3657154.1 T9SS type A sorting domain-containing protein [Fulvivirga sediminis]